MENWKDIEGYNGIYRISDCGNVFSSRIGRNLAFGGIRYKCVSLTIGGKGRTFSIHRLVANHFISNPKGLNCVNHVDFDILNNHVSNLEWCSILENLNHSRKNNRMRGYTRGVNIKHSKAVLNVNTGIYYDSIIEAYESGVFPYCSKTLSFQLSKAVKNYTPFIFI